MTNLWHQFLKSQKGKGLNMTQLSNMYRMTGGGLGVETESQDELDMRMYPYTLMLEDGTVLATIEVMYVGDSEFIDYVSENDILTGTEFQTVTLMHYMTEKHPDITDFAPAELVPDDGEGEDADPDSDLTDLDESDPYRNRFIYVVQRKFASEFKARWIYVPDMD